jgi:hypothetical protein
VGPKLEDTMPKLSLSALRDPSPGVNYPDPAVQGLRYRARASGKVYAEIRFKARVNGKPVWKSEQLGRVNIEEREEDLITEEADWREGDFSMSIPLDLLLAPWRERAREVRRRLRHGEDPRTGNSLGAVINRYLADIADKRRPRTLKEIERHLMKHWEPLHHRPITSLTADDIADHLAVLEAENGVVARNRARADLSALFNWAAKPGRRLNVLANPVTPTDKLKERPRKRVLTFEEMRAIWQATDGPGDYDAIVRLVLLSAQRRTAIGDMRWHEVAGPVWRIPAERMKREEDHEITLPRQAVEILAGRPRREGRDLVFGDGVSGFSGWSRCKGRLDARIAEMRGAPLPAWGLHDARRSLRSLGPAKLGIEPWVAKAILHHAESGIDRHYHHPDAAELTARALQRWADWITG